MTMLTGVFKIFLAHFSCWKGFCRTTHKPEEEVKLAPKSHEERFSKLAFIRYCSNILKQHII